MSLSILDPSHGGYKPTAQQISLDVSPSSSTSSQDSIFSHASSQSSLATQSSASDKPQCLPSQALHNSFTQQSGYFRPDPCAPAIYQHASVSAEQRQHPRRTSSDGASKPPALVRQDERKALFVNDLVGKLDDGACHTNPAKTQSGRLCYKSGRSHLANVLVSILSKQPRGIASATLH